MNVHVDTAATEQQVLMMSLLYLSFALMMRLLAVKKRSSSKRLTSMSRQYQLLRRWILQQCNIAKLQCLALQRTSAHRTISRKSRMLKMCNPLDTETLFLPCKKSSATEPTGALAKLKRRTVFALPGPDISF